MQTLSLPPPQGLAAYAQTQLWYSAVVTWDHAVMNYDV